MGIPASRCVVCLSEHEARGCEVAEANDTYLTVLEGPGLVRGVPLGAVLLRLAWTHSDAGWSSLVARLTLMDPMVAGPNPAPAAISSRVVRVLRVPIRANLGRPDGREGCRYALRGRWPAYGRAPRLSC